MSIEIEIYFNFAPIKTHKFSITDTLANARRILGYSEDYIFTHNDKEIPFNEEDKYVIKDIHKNKKLYIKKKKGANMFLSMTNKNKNNEINKKNDSCKINKKNDIKQDKEIKNLMILKKRIKRLKRKIIRK